MSGQVTLMDDAGSADDARARLARVAAILNQSADAPGSAGDLDRIAAADAVLRDFGGDTDPETRDHLALALFAKGLAQGRLGRHQDAIQTWFDLGRRFAVATRMGPARLVASGLISQGNSLVALGRADDAVSCYDSALRRLGAATSPVLVAAMALDFLNYGRWAFLQSGLVQDPTKIRRGERPCLGRLRDRFIQGKEPGIQRLRLVAQVDRLYRREDPSTAAPARAAGLAMAAGFETGNPALLIEIIDQVLVIRAA